MKNNFNCFNTYRDEIYSLQILLSRTQAGPGRTVKEKQEEISPNHVQRINLISVQCVFQKDVDVFSYMVDYVNVVNELNIACVLLEILSAISS